MSETAKSVASGFTPRRGDYGVDAPYAPIVLALCGLVALALLVVGLVLRWPVGANIWWAAWTVVFVGGAASYLYTTRRGKFRSWARILDAAGLHGDERILDLGCGRGAVLLMAAQRLTTGRAVGVDLWRTSDQSGNAEETTRGNARAEGVAGRVDLCTGDMADLPLPDHDFDLVVSSLAIHNIPSPAGRDRAIDEAVRVLRPGGSLLLADFRHTRRYAARLTELGLANVRRRGLGWRFWYGGPWTGTALVTATKPVE